MSEFSHHDIKQMCLGLLSRGELTRYLLIKKLSDRGVSSDTVIEVIDELEDQGWQSDSRYTEQYLAMRSRKGFGPVRIQMELVQRGIDDCSANRAVWSIQWQEHLARTYLKKYDRKSIPDWQELAKRMRFLQYRGFTTEQINAYIQILDHHG